MQAAFTLPSGMKSAGPLDRPTGAGWKAGQTLSAPGRPDDGEQDTTGIMQPVRLIESRAHRARDRAL
jgi:hypothetical protein